MPDSSNPVTDADQADHADHAGHVDQAGRTGRAGEAGQADYAGHVGHAGHAASPMAWHAHLSLAFARDGAATRLTGRRHSGPLRVQKALYPEGPEVCHTIVIHPPGGVVGGDRLALDAVAGEGAHAVLTTPGAAKWYRANGRTSGQQVSLAAARGAAIEWLPQESIFYDDARVELEHDVQLAEDAAYLGCEILCLGRRAAGESFNTGHIRQRTRIRRGGKLLWWEQGVLTPRILASPLGLAGHTVCATLLAVGTAFPAELLAALRALGATDASGIPGMPGAGAGAGPVAGGPLHWGATLAGKHVLAIRHLGHDSEAARELMLAALHLVRPALLGRAGHTPRSWRT